MTLDLDATVRLDRRQDVRDADRAIEPLAVRRVGGDGDLERAARSASSFFRRRFAASVATAARPFVKR